LPTQQIVGSFESDRESTARNTAQSAQIMATCIKTHLSESELKTSGDTACHRVAG
jgi:hypothetical protein